MIMHNGTLHIIESTATGTLSIAAMAANAQSRHHSVAVIYSRRPDTPENIEELFASGIHLIEEKMQANYFPMSILSLRKRIRQLKPNIIHCHSSFAGFLGRLAAIGLKTKVYYSPHCISFMRQDIGLLKSGLFKLFETFACIKPATYIACSQSEVQAIHKALPFVDVTLLENAVDLSEFSTQADGAKKGSAQKHAAQQDSFTVVTVGGIRPQKGPDEFVQIALRLKDMNLNVNFVWIGDGESPEKRWLLDAGVTVTGWKPKAEVIEMLHQADLYLSTSRWEGMPVSVIEACAAGLPVIARNCAGNCDVVMNGINGLLFDQTENAVQVITQFVKQPDSFQYMVERAQQEVFNRFSIERFSNQLKAIYNE
jgi:glycosyltransferase involved in cell wall biosynthesis